MLAGNGHWEDPKEVAETRLQAHLKRNPPSILKYEMNRQSVSSSKREVVKVEREWASAFLQGNSSLDE